MGENLELGAQRTKELIVTETEAFQRVSSAYDYSGRLFVQDTSTSSRERHSRVSTRTPRAGSYAGTYSDACSDAAIFPMMMTAFGYQTKAIR